MRAGLVIGVAIAALLGFAAPAWPTDVSIYGQTLCTTGDQTVNWTITNAAPTIGMTISYVVASIGPQQYTTTGWNPSVPGDASTNATTLVPAGVSGQLVLNVYATWANGATRVVGGVIDLPSNCTPPTTTTTTTTAPPTTTPPTTTTTTWSDTTTTQPETATTQPETATTQPETATTAPEPTTIPGTPPIEETTTTTESVGGTTIATATTDTTEPGTPTTVIDAGNPGTPGTPTPGGPTTTTKPGKPTLPRTGTATTFLFVFGAFFVAIGGSILMHKRNSWAALRGHETTADVRKQLEKRKRALTVYLPPRR
jgi:LPXTG-motif cell wall-anchored protein